MRPYLDDDIASALLVRALRQAGHDVQIPFHVGMSGNSDAAHLIHAIRERRVTMTRNHEDFEELHLLIRQAQGAHPGILAVRRDNDPRRNLNPKDMVRALRNLENAPGTVGRSRLGVDGRLMECSTHSSSGSVCRFGDLAMDGTATMSEIRQTFSTPVRILLPKLLKGRDDWKAKSHQRKAQLKSAKIKIRDLSVSRDMWRERAERSQGEARRLQEQLERTQRELEATRTALTQLEVAQKK